MEITAEAKNVKISPRKVRLVVDGIKKYKIPMALSYLVAMRKRSSIPVKKTLESAIANAVNNLKLKREDLIIKDILVNEGISYKRYHFAARGRVRPYKKRTSHIKVILANKSEARNSKSETKKDKKGGSV